MKQIGPTAGVMIPRDSGSGETRPAAQASLPTRALPEDSERGGVEQRPAAAAPSPQLMWGGSEWSAYDLRRRWPK